MVRGRSEGLVEHWSLGHWVQVLGPMSHLRDPLGSLGGHLGAPWEHLEVPLGVAWGPLRVPCVP